MLTCGALHATSLATLHTHTLQVPRPQVGTACHLRALHRQVSLGQRGAVLWGKLCSWPPSQ